MKNFAYIHLDTQKEKQDHFSVSKDFSLYNFFGTYSDRVYVRNVLLSRAALEYLEAQSPS